MVTVRGDGVGRSAVGVRLPGQRASEQAVTLRVAVVVRHRSMADLLALALTASAGFAFAGQASTAQDAMRLLEQDDLDVLVVDADLDGDQGLRLARTARDRRPGVRVVALVGTGNPTWLGRAAQAGVGAVVDASGGLAELVAALRGARSGTMAVPAAMLSGQPGAAGPTLTPRETEVLGRLAEGLHVTAAARRLGISPHTARGYVKSILSKLDCHSQLEAVVTASRLGLLPLPVAG